MTKKNSLIHDLAAGKLRTRPVAEIEQDLDETIQWAEIVAKAYPIRVRRGRPLKDQPGGPSRSVTVRFPPDEARRVLASAEAMGFSLSEFVRAAAFSAASHRLLTDLGRSNVSPKGPASKSSPGRKGTVKD